MKKFILKNAMAVAAMAIAAGSYGLMSFGTNIESTDKLQSTVLFEYEAPSVSNPYDDVHVKNPSNWKRATTPGCPSPGLEAPCTIEVEEANTLDDGQLIDPSAVSIETTNTGPNQFMVDTPTPSSGYSNPINASLP